MSSISFEKRTLIYSFGGMACEVFYTGLKDFPKFRADTQLWVLPLYGLGGSVVFERLHEKMRHRPMILRVCAYVGTFFLIEYCGGWITHQLIGECPWKYEGRWNVHGFINLTFIPIWGTLGLMAEKVHDYLLTYNLRH